MVIATCKECIHDKICFFQVNTPSITKCPHFKTADVEEVKHGCWTHSTEKGVGYALCSACNSQMSIFSYGYPYCPMCGAKMDGERKGGAR